MFKFHYIHEFVLLAETLNFSKTAELTYITQPALSRHIAIIEEEVGAKLFERTTRSVALTASGDAVYRHCKTILQNWEAAKETAVFLSEGMDGMLGISSPYYWTEEFTEPVVKAFMEKYPSCDIRIISCQPHEGLDDLNADRSDIFISYWMDELDPAIRREPYATERMCDVCMDDHPLAGKETVALDELRGCDLITLGYGSIDYKNHAQVVLNMLSKVGIYPSISYTQQVDTLGLSMQRTNNISIMPYGTRHMDRSYLRFIPISDEGCTIPICLYYRMENENPLLPGFVRAAKRAFHQRSVEVASEETSNTP